MNMRCFFVLIILTFSLPTFAERLSLFAPIPGAKLYEVKIVGENSKTAKTYRLRQPVLETDKIAAGDYIMTARYLNVRDKWSDWTDKASLKIVKKIKTNTRDIFDDKFPFGGSLGFGSLNTKLTSGAYEFESTESVLRSKIFIQRHPFKLTAAYDKSENMTRFDTSILKQINVYASAGINFWMVNFDGRNTTDSSTGLINFTQSFLELDYMYPFWDRWYLGSKFGLGLGLSYYIRPELTYSVPFGDQFFVSGTLLYELSRVEQSDFKFDVNGASAYVNFSYFLEM